MATLARNVVIVPHVKSGARNFYFAVKYFRVHPAHVSEHVLNDSPRFLRMIFPKQNNENTMLVFALFRHVCARIRDKLPKSFDKNFLLKYEADYENNVNACVSLDICA